MKILLITDSLGCPREEIEVHKTWTYNIMKKYSSSDVIFYTLLKRGLNTSMIDLNYIKDLKPDVIICQVGIVDCCRRAFPDSFINVVKKIPILSKITHFIAHKFHFQLTRLYNIKRVKSVDFKTKISKLVNLCSNNDIDLLYITIAPPGEHLTKKVYNVGMDINNYNKILNSFEQPMHIINPYKDKLVEEFLIEEDGHHLNEYGHQLVFNSIDLNIKKLIAKATLSIK